jgi:mannose-6-phosphate isomerase-like protein (cupin superfamily)
MNNIQKILKNTSIIPSLLAELEFNSNNTYANWGFNTKRQKIKYHIHTETIPLIKSDYKQDQGPYLELPYLSSLYPCAKNFIETLENITQGKIINAMYVKLLPEHKIYPHRDNEHTKTKFYNLHDRYHFVLQGEYELIVEEEIEILYPGDLVMFENTKTHSVNNLKKIDRIALIFDVRK